MAAAVLPPRKLRQAEEVTIKRNRSSLEVLMQTGFSRQRAEKALAATGDKGVHLASDWLLSHANDPNLDQDIPRDYILYLCPVGQLQQHFIEFWKKSYETCGWNRAHNYFPHITLCSFFKASDSVISKMSHMTKTISERYASQLAQLELDFFSSANFIGLFVSSEATEFLRKIVNEFSEEFKSLGVQMEPHKKQLHISLAYQLRPQDKEKLEAQVKDIKLDLPVRWDLRLYSRDPRISNCQIRKVLFEHEPRYEDELRLIVNDFIYLNEEEIKSSPDGWCQGISWLSGCSGMFPVSYTERVAETETWTMHRSIPIIGTDIGIRIEEEPGQNNGPIEFDNPVYHEGGNKAAVVGPVNVLHFPASPKRSKKSPQSDALSTNNSSDQTPELPPPRASVKDRQQKALSSTPAEPPKTAQNHVQSATNSTGANPNHPHVAQNQSKPSGTGPPLLVPRRTPPAASVSHPAPAADPSVSSQKSAAAASNSAATANSKPAVNLVGSATMPANASRSKPTPKQAPVPSVTHNAMHASASPSIGRKSDSLKAKKSRGPRQLYVVRHGERIDFTFGKDWIRNSFDSGGNYIRYDLNMPKALPKRKGGPKSFEKDSPLTTQGHFQANLLGTALKDVEVPISHVYASPSLRCVQTATEILNGLGIQRSIHVEPGLFEWLGWYRNGMPAFMSNAEFTEAGFHVDPDYEPVYPPSRFNMDEKAEQYYDRCHEVTKTILQRHEDEGGNVLLVGHAASLDVCTRQLVGHPPRGHVDFNSVLCQVPYCSVAVAQEGVHVKEAWYIIEPPILPFAHTNNPKYNWTILTTPLNT